MKIDEMLFKACVCVVFLNTRNYLDTTLFGVVVAKKNIYGVVRRNVRRGCFFFFFFRKFLTGRYLIYYELKQCWVG